MQIFNRLILNTSNTKLISLCCSKLWLNCSQFGHSAIMEESVPYGIFAKIYNCSMSTQHLSEQEIIRREKLEELKKLGIDAYPAALYPVNTTSVFIKENYKGESFDYAQYCRPYYECT
jgi:hypothetical protein